MNIWEAAPYISCSKALSLNDSNFFPASIMSILSIVMLICFSVGLPVLLISLLFYNKAVLFTQRIRMRLGFLYEAYRPVTDPRGGPGGHRPPLEVRIFPIIEFLET